MHPVDALYVGLDPDFEFDRAVLDAFPVEWEPVGEGVLRFSKLPPRHTAAWTGPALSNSNFEETQGMIAGFGC